MPTTLSEWSTKVVPFLHEIEWFSKRVANAAAALPVRPDFLSLAEHELLIAETTLESALLRIREAKTSYYAKQPDKSHAA